MTDTATPMAKLFPPEAAEYGCFLCRRPRSEMREWAATVGTDTGAYVYCYKCAPHVEKWIERNPDETDLLKMRRGR